MQVLLSAWGFRPEELRVPVRIWQGDEDGMLRSSFGDTYGASISNCMGTHEDRRAEGDDRRQLKLQSLEG